jgi:hypothetical protein
MGKICRAERTARKWVTKRVRSECKLTTARLNHCVPGNKEDSYRKREMDGRNIQYKRLKKTYLKIYRRQQR